jgi:hypothetical protein
MKGVSLAGDSWIMRLNEGSRTITLDFGPRRPNRKSRRSKQFADVLGIFGGKSGVVLHKRLRRALRDLPEVAPCVQRVLLFARGTVGPLPGTAFNGKVVLLDSGSYIAADDVLSITLAEGAPKDRFAETPLHVIHSRLRVRRFSAFKDDFKFDRKNKRFRRNTWVAPLADTLGVRTAAEAKARYALPAPPNGKPHIYNWLCKLRAGEVFFGPLTVLANFGEPGGGVEMFLPYGSRPRSVRRLSELPV